MRPSMLLMFGLAVYSVAALPMMENNGEKRLSPRFVEIPGADGEMHLVDLEAEHDHELLREIERNPANNAYLLFTRRNPTVAQILVINNANSITRSNFNARVPTVIIAHGWLSNQLTDINPVVRRAYLNKSDVNVIVLDWSRLASADYMTAVNGVPAVGRGLGQFLAFLNRTTGAAFTSMHLIGYSLGAHLVGNAGRELNGRVARVTGLDPAGPFWNTNNNRLRGTDGVYVEAIHTDGGTAGLGIGSAVANADFFPNGGITQPGCDSNLCNHERSWQYFAATVTHNHMIGRQCTNMAQVAQDACRGIALRMGNDILNKRGSGLFRVNTGSRYPY